MHSNQSPGRVGVLRKEKEHKALARATQSIEQSTLRKNKDASKQKSKYVQRAEESRKARKQQIADSCRFKKMKIEENEYPALKKFFQTNYNVHEIVKRVQCEVDSSQNSQLGLESEPIIKRILSYRDSLVHPFCKLFLTVKSKLKSNELKLKEVSSDDAKFVAMFGPSLHTKISESYFALHQTEQIVDAPYADKGDTELSRQASELTQWVCTDSCNIDKKLWFHRLYSISRDLLNMKPDEICNFLENVDICSNKESDSPIQIQHNDSDKKLMLGHPFICHETDNACPSVLLFLRRVAPHFPFIRFLVKNIYSIRRLRFQIGFASDLLINGSLTEIQKFESQIRSNVSTYELDSFPSKEEKDIHEKFSSAFVALRKKEKEHNLPLDACYSCLKLCSKALLQQYSRKLAANLLFKDLLSFHEGFESPFKSSLSPDKICLYCAKKFSQKKLPPRCILNGMHFKPIPDCISALNDFEIVFIQRAKAFQVLTRMNAVSGSHNKHRPLINVNRKDKGRTFHLPLPIENTLSESPGSNHEKSRSFHCRSRNSYKNSTHMAVICRCKKDL